MRAGGQLIAQHAASLVIGAGGLALLSRLLGPATFGTYAAAVALLQPLRLVARLGITADLLRRTEDPTPHEYRTAATLLALTGAAAAVAAWPLAAMAQALGDLERLRAAAVVMAWRLPLDLTVATALVPFERRLDYRPTGVVEVGGQLVQYAVAASLALAGAGLWAAVAGWWARGIAAAAYAGARSRVLPLSPLALRWSAAGPMVRFGVAHAISTALWNGRRAVVAVVLGRWLGEAAVGHAALADRAVGFATPLRGASARILLPLLGRLRGRPRLHQQAIHLAQSLELPAALVVLAGLVTAGPPLLPLVLGEAWRPAATLLPFAAAAAIPAAIGGPHLSALHAAGRFRRPIGTAITQLAALAVITAAAVGRFGLAGYGAALVLTSAAWLALAAGQPGAVPLGWALAASAALLAGIWSPFATLTATATWTWAWVRRGGGGTPGQEATPPPG